jgi:hypothetical protein
MVRATFIPPTFCQSWRGGASFFLLTAIFFGTSETAKPSTFSTSHPLPFPVFPKNAFWRVFPLNPTPDPSFPQKLVLPASCRPQWWLPASLPAFLVFKANPFLTRPTVRHFAVFV